MTTCSPARPRAVQRNGVVLGAAHSSTSLGWIDRDGRMHPHGLDPRAQ